MAESFYGNVINHETGITEIQVEEIVKVDDEENNNEKYLKTSKILPKGKVIFDSGTGLGITAVDKNTGSICYYHTSLDDPSEPAWQRSELIPGSKSIMLSHLTSLDRDEMGHVLDYSQEDTSFDLVGGYGEGEEYSEIFNDYSNNIASGSYSHAEGQETQATGIAAHAEGKATEALGIGAHAEGYNTQAKTDYTHAEGNGTIAEDNPDDTLGGRGAHAEGYRTQALGRASHSEGGLTQATGRYAHAEGQESIASGYASHAEGEKTQSIAEGAHTEGHQTTASGNYSHAEGELTLASGLCSHAEGRGTEAIG
jgi:hypothetical protein